MTQAQVIEAFKQLSAGEQLAALETMTSEVEKRVIASRLVARMNAYPLPADTPAFTREDLHERR